MRCKGARLCASREKSRDVGRRKPMRLLHHGEIKATEPNSGERPTGQAALLSFYIRCKWKHNKCYRKGAAPDAHMFALSTDGG